MNDTQIGQLYCASPWVYIVKYQVLTWKAHITHGLKRLQSLLGQHNGSPLVQNSQAHRTSIISVP